MCFFRLHILCKSPGFRMINRTYFILSVDSGLRSRIRSSSTKTWIHRTVNLRCATVVFIKLCLQFFSALCLFRIRLRPGLLQELLHTVPDLPLLLYLNGRLVKWRFVSARKITRDCQNVQCKF